MEAYDLSAYDGVLAFGEALSEVYRRKGQTHGVIEATRRLDKAWAGDKRALDLARL